MSAQAAGRWARRCSASAKSRIAISMIATWLTPFFFANPLIVSTASRVRRNWIGSLWPCLDLAGMDDIDIVAPDWRLQYNWRIQRSVEDSTTQDSADKKMPRRASTFDGAIVNFQLTRRSGAGQVAKYSLFQHNCHLPVAGLPLLKRYVMYDPAFVSAFAACLNARHSAAMEGF